MKRQTQFAGVKRWYADNLLDLQREPLKAVDQFLCQFGPCVISGCNVIPNGTRFDISSGLVSLKGAGPDGPVNLVVPFRGATSVSLPLYLSLAYETIQGQYDNGEVKPVSYDYYAKATNIAPSGTYIELKVSGAVRFTDVLQDTLHRFITDTERTMWNAKETPMGAQTKADTALTAAKSYANAINTAVRTAFASADATTLASAKSYTDQLVSRTAGGDLRGDYPNPTIGTSKVTAAKLATGAVVEPKIGNSAVSWSKLSTDVQSRLKTTYVVQLDVPLSSYIIGLGEIIRDEEEAGCPYTWMRSILNQGYSNIIIRGTDGATMSSVRITVNTLNSYIGVLFFTSSAVNSAGAKANLILSRLIFGVDDRGGVGESKLTLGQI